MFILLMMYFVAAPVSGEGRPWALQSVHSMEFTSKQGCEEAIDETIIPAVQTTDTVSVFAWCLPKGGSGKANIAAADPAKSSIGRCYSYVPPPIGAKDRAKKKEQALRRGDLGSSDCNVKGPR